ncbi:cytochrome P450 [Polyplosphaeria fusca]|uniref:Bifunctional cytochrome P450/NADPH--P450 reductase n=1 Tax=Polyplosphaeria fusca TaxID=682080 RepID=A0A9P4QN71_9PLEO|nr:cytochrome P450 [Polyplosphaeria fusca]
MASVEELAAKGLPIPQPPSRLFIGNAGEIDPANLPQSMWRLADVYGEIFQLDMPGGRKLVVCNNYELNNDLCDGTRFEKVIGAALKEVRALIADGLFTAYPNEKGWGIAHRLLMPVFGPITIRKMLPEMNDIVSQMLLRWDRFGPENELVCADEFTRCRLAFDVIGLAAFGYRFNNFYRENAHPFVTQMADVLLECGKRANRTGIENALRVFSAQENAANIKAMQSLCDEIVADRKKNPQPELNDLLNPMLENTDPVTGEKMSDELIRNNLCTFLVAGHETTSGTLGFLFYHLLKNPDKYMKLQKEVDEVLGDGPFEAKHVSQLPYLKFCIYETLRYMGPIATPGKHAIKPTLIAGKYYVEPSTQLVMNLKPFHHDPKVWGDDADTFRPERWMDGGFEKLPPNAFKAFGDGERACIGRTFAEQEMILAVATIFQKFQVEMADPSYQMNVKVTLTLKPNNFAIKVRRRPGRSVSTTGAAAPTPSPTTALQGGQERRDSGVNGFHEQRPVTVLYGSQSGTCKAYAQDIESNAPRYGFKATVDTLDSATENIPKDQPVIIICPSYEGRPADNAKKFVTWLQANADSPKVLDGVNYTVFGVGNSDWVDSFHRVPKLIDELFEKMGAHRRMPTGYVDVKYDIMGPWEEFADNLWKVLREETGQDVEVASNLLQAEITAPTFASHLGGKDIGYGIVKENRSLGGKQVGLEKKHIEIELPLGSGYQSGDYLVVLPTNPLNTVRRLLKRFGISPDDSILVTGTNKAYLSPDTSISVFDLMMTRVELGTPASQKQIQTLIDATPGDKRSKLTPFLDDSTYQASVLEKRFTILDLLEDNPSTDLPFPVYLDMLKPLTPRQYSISSSPFANLEFVTTPSGTMVQKLFASLTYDVHDEAALSGHGQFHGVASTYLARHEPGERIRCFARPTNANFHLPTDPLTPIIMACAGSGMAPMRAFIQERAAIKAARNQKLGPAVLYFGCRDEGADYIYADELAAWEKEGIVSVRPCFSKSGAGAPKYVHERIWEDREELRSLFAEKGAKIFVCGSASKLAKSTADVCKKIYMEAKGVGEDEAREWLEKVKEDRYVSDVFE